MPESAPASRALLKARPFASRLTRVSIRKTPAPPVRKAAAQIRGVPVNSVMAFAPKKALSTRNTHRPLSLCRNSWRRFSAFTGSFGGGFIVSLSV